MIRLAVWILMMIFFSILETSFFGSLPGFLTLTPLVLAISVYLVQHQGVHLFVWWLPAHGLFLDSLSPGFTVYDFFPYIVSAILISLTAKHLFSNRSYYGVLSCALTGCVGLIVAEAGLFLLQHIAHVSVDWLTFLSESVLRLILLLVVITFFYPFAKPIHTFLVSFSLLPERRKTY